MMRISLYRQGVYAAGHKQLASWLQCWAAAPTTAALGGVAGMQIDDDQGRLLTMLAGLVGARRAVEFGTVTGYSALCIARGLSEDGSLLCCDISAEWTAIGADAWRESGLADEIEARIGCASGRCARCRPRQLSTRSSSMATKPAAANIGD